MASKQIQLKSKNPIILDPTAVLSQVNYLRKEKGNKKKDKTPISVEQFVAQTKALVSRSEEFGTLYLRLEYKDNEGTPCVRDFPNFGLEVISQSTITIEGDQIAVFVDLTAKSGKKKWQAEELQECAEILANGDTKLTLHYCCDITTDPSGYSTSIDVQNGEKTESGSSVLPVSAFEVVTK